MESKITAIVVIFNKTISQSITCQRIKAMDRNIDVLVVDNSEISNSNEIVCKELGFRYLSMNGNKGLSKAYNAAVDHSKNTDVIVLFDDDTEITEEYFQILDKALKKYPDVDIFAPIIRGQDNVIYSPNEFNFLRNHFILSPAQEISQRSFNAIASCLAIRIKVFDNYRFNEKLFVDQVDQYFFCEQRKLDRKFGKLDIEVRQNFHQRGTTLTPKDGWRRLRLRIVDIFRHARLVGSRKYIFLALVKCCGLGVQIGKKSRSVSIVFKAGFLSLLLTVRDI